MTNKQTNLLSMRPSDKRWTNENFEEITPGQSFSIVENMENSAANVSSRTRRQSSREHSISNPTSRTVYLEPQPLFSPKKLSQNRSSFLDVYGVGKCTIWYEESFDGDKKLTKLFIDFDGKRKFSDRWLLTVKVTTTCYPEGQLLTFKGDNEWTEEQFNFNIDLPGSDLCEVFMYDFRLNGDILTNPSYGHRFDSAGNPHDIVLNFRNSKLYCSKLVLATLSDYFDRLFFSETADPNITSHDLPDLKAETVMKLLNIGIFPDGEIYVSYGYLNIRELQAALFLEMRTLGKSVTSEDVACTAKRYWRFPEGDDDDRSEDVMIALELSEKYKLDVLLEECTNIFCEYFSEDMKKNFFIEYTDRLKKLSWRTIVKFTTEGLGSEVPENFDDLFEKAESTPPEMQTPDRNTNKLKDVTLLVAGQRFSVHKEYLAFWSPYFDRLFFGGFSEAGKNEIKLKDIDPLEFDILLEMIYSPRCFFLNSSNVTFLLKLADRFEMKSIMNTCGRYLARKITVDIPGIPLMDLVELVDTYNFIDAQASFIVKLRSLGKRESTDFLSGNRSRIEKLNRRFMMNIMLSL